MRILLTGGTGLIGRALCRHWTAQGHDVLVLSRQPQRVAALCSGARGVARLQDIASPAPVDAVVNLAGAPIDQPWTASRRALLWRSRVELTRHLVDWMRVQATAPRVLISGSAVGWYGDAGEAPLDEGSAPARPHFGSRLCAAWEDEASRAAQAGTRVVLLRTAPVLTPEGGMLARLRLPFRLGLGARLGGGRQWMPWIHLHDQVALVDFALHEERCVGPWNACAPEPVRNATFTQALAHALHRPAVLAAPAWALRGGLGEMSVLLLGSQRVLPRRALEAGFAFGHPHLAPALEDLLGAPRLGAAR